MLGNGVVARTTNLWRSSKLLQESINMIKFAIAALTASIFLTGCGAATDSEGVQNAAESVTEDEFADALKSEVPAVDPVPDVELERTAEGICSSVDEFAPLDDDELDLFVESFYAGASNVMTLDEAQTFVEYSIEAYCPEVRS